MIATTLPVRTEDAPPQVPIEIVSTRGRGDRTFFRGLGLSGFLVLALMASVGIFLTYEALEALRVSGPSFLTTSKWEPDAGSSGFGIAAIMPFTILIAFIAVLIAAPIAHGDGAVHHRGGADAAAVVASSPWST